MTTKEPPSVAILSARIMRAYPSLSAYSAASLATELCAIERAQRRHAERCCSGADGGYVRRAEPGENVRCTLVHDPDAEERAGKRIEARTHRWRDRVQELTRQVAKTAAIELQGDPRGPVLLVRFPGETEAVAV